MIGEPVTEPEFWELIGVDNIIKYFMDRKLNYLIYRTGEMCASTMEFDQRPVGKVEVDIVGRPRIIQYFSNYETVMSRWSHWSPYDK